jgi:acetoin utilization deacetylase AcuC-like enzyme
MPLKVGIVRDERYFAHQTGPSHPERAARLKSVYRMLDKEFSGSVSNISPEPAALDQLELFHTPTYISRILKTSERELSILAPGTPAGPESYSAAWLGVGGCVKALRYLLAGRYDACFCMVRPPGHSAGFDRARDYCIFNNIGVTAQYAVERYDLQRVLIIDWDIHHGTGLQEVFYDSDRVFYLSTHYEFSDPVAGAIYEAGAGHGLGYNLNIPVPKDINDEDLLYVYSRVLAPIMKKFKPELILIAAGFDGHHRDPVGRTRLTEKFYGNLTGLLLELRDAVRSPPLLFSLEGGFDAAALTSCVREVLNQLVFTGRRSRVSVELSPRGMEIVESSLEVHNRFHVWTD